MFAASDPHSGSVIAKAAIASPLATSRQPFALLLDRAEQRDRARARGPASRRRSRRARMVERASRGTSARLRTSGRCLPSATHSLRKPAAPSSRTSVAAFAVEIVAAAARSSAHHCAAHQVSMRVRPASSRCLASSKKGQAEEALLSRHQSPWNTGVLLVRERFVGALEIVGFHAPRLRPRLRLERVLDASRATRRRAAAWSRMGDRSARSRAASASA